MNNIEQSIVEAVEKLDRVQQEQVLRYAQQLEQDSRQWITGEELVALVRSLDFNPQDVALMAQAIEEDCERIDPDDGH